MATGTDNPYEVVARVYGAIRPRNLAGIFDSIEQYADLPLQPRVLEVGPGPGQTTHQMVERGWDVEAIEPGSELASELVASCQGSTVRVLNARFEDVAVESAAFDLVVAATSWHWIDPTVGYDKARRVLRPHGSIALVWNAHQSGTLRPDWVPIRQAYLDIAPGLADLAPLTPNRAAYDPYSELRASGAFIDIDQRRWPFNVEYSTSDFLALIGTYASHRALDAETFGRLQNRLRATIDSELGGRVTKPYEALLVLGRRRPGTTL